LLLLAPAAAAQLSFVEIRERYFSASFEEALTMLNRLKDGGPLPAADALEIEEYRVLCLLALDRLPEAERVIEGIVTAEPLRRLEEADLSPRLSAVFHAVRQRTLPTVVRRVYSDAKTTFERKEYVQAAALFETVKAILDDPDMKHVNTDGSNDRNGSDDLRTLAAGFHRLSLAAAEPPREARVEPPPPPKVELAAQPPSAALPRIYASTDAGVIPPVVVRQEMPAWPPVALRRPSGRGVLELVIGESGEVESATLREPVNSLYDELLLAAARTWRYKAATKDGKPVRFRRVMRVSLDAPGGK